MLKSLQDTFVASAQRRAFLAHADAAYEQMCESGEGYDAGEVHRYIQARARGESVERPQPEAWRE